MNCITIYHLVPYILQDNDSNQKEQEVSDKEQYQTDRYEQEKFTDTYTEDFTDDNDKVDRFTDTYRENFTDD